MAEEYESKKEVAVNKLKKMRQRRGKLRLDVGVSGSKYSMGAVVVGVCRFRIRKDFGSEF